MCSGRDAETIKQESEVKYLNRWLQRGNTRVVSMKIAPKEWRLCHRAAYAALQDLFINGTLSTDIASFLAQIDHFNADNWAGSGQFNVKDVSAQRHDSDDGLVLKVWGQY